MFPAVVSLVIHNFGVVVDIPMTRVLRCHDTFCVDMEEPLFSPTRLMNPRLPLYELIRITFANALIRFPFRQPQSLAGLRENTVRFFGLFLNRRSSRIQPRREGEPYANQPSPKKRSNRPLNRRQRIRAGAWQSRSLGAGACP